MEISEHCWAVRHECGALLWLHECDLWFTSGRYQNMPKPQKPPYEEEELKKITYNFTSSEAFEIIWSTFRFSSSYKRFIRFGLSPSQISEGFFLNYVGEPYGEPPIIEHNGYPVNPRVLKFCSLWDDCFRFFSGQNFE